ncbi:hypothetical protein ABZ917_17680 [Nonomuraea wenchangensis]
MSLMGNHGYDESTEPGELLDALSDAEYFAQTFPDFPAESFAGWVASLSDAQRARTTLDEISARVRS